VRPVAIAHRGDPLAHRENTLAAYDAAVRAGADMVEVDVRRTADGAAACLHDATLERVWGDPRAVASLTRAELASIGVPDLGDVLASIPVQVMVDYTAADVVDPALEAILAARALDRCVFAGECFEGHRRIRSLHAGARIALTWTAAGVDPVPLLDELGAELFNPDVDILLRELELVEQMHERGTAVSTWTIDDPDTMELALDYGVDAIITNRIHDLVGLLAGREVREAC